jgi:SAM-dependent methyltransferase
MSSSATEVTPDTLKAGHRTMWAAGDYAAVAGHVDAAPARALLGRLPAVADRDVLDVATGSGNLALHLAAAGARVTGLDLVDELLDIARERAIQRGADVAWVAGDAEALPFADATFDVATSIFGIQFAPRHQVAADELVRVVRPGGTIGLVNWTPEGMVGQMFGVLGRHLPAPPSFASPPPRWGDPDHVRALFGDRVTDLAFTRGINTFRFPTLDAFATFFEDNYGPTLTARGKLGEEAWALCRDGLREVYATVGDSTSDGFAIDSEFTVITARRTTF